MMACLAELPEDELSCLLEEKNTKDVLKVNDKTITELCSLPLALANNLAT